MCFAIVAGTCVPAGAVDRSIGAATARPAVGGAPWAADDVAALQRDLAAILADSPTLRGAHVGAVAASASDGTALFEANADGAFQPASTMKLLTGSVALERLGPAFRFVTTLERVPEPAGGATFVLRGGGDPLLRSSDVDAAAGAAVTAAAGASPVQITIDTSHVAPSERHPAGWNIDDALAYYAPVINGLPFEENLLHARVIPAAAVGDVPAVVLAAPFKPQSVPARGCRDGPAVLTFTVEAKTVARGTPSTLDIMKGRCGDIVVTGVIPQGAPESIDAAIDEPEELVRVTLTAGLARRGVVAGPVPPSFGAIPGVVEGPFRSMPAGPVVWRHAGEPLADVLADLWEPSDNLVGEMLLREIDVAANGRAGTAEGGAAIERAWLRSVGIDPSGVTLVDGSGLSQYDRLTPRALLTVLRHDWLGPNRDTVLDDLPIAGVRGSMRNDMHGTPAEGRVFAKTGSMMHVRGLAGFVATRTHGTAAFALMVDDWMGDDPGMDALRAAFCSRLAQS